MPLDQSPKDDPNSLFKHSLITAYYRREGRVIDPQDRLILDAGCGSGYKCLMLAEANPGAKIVGMDLSEKVSGDDSATGWRITGLIR
ncbi:methyltransferase domain-containing protein [Leptolyngbya sp. O-77]|uniref:methyltransferase domain-containing protein n=1 Tax=Leptolyngbya sp. O-77 TaxID=1080068 RepID=UPI00074D4328|nr:class I SAM-dependent methyltransferase [Leptolyngbya sp. O-77]BAU41837.1 Methyltransferase domain protein [Leptolyngbya sp. O-77]